MPESEPQRLDWGKLLTSERRPSNREPSPRPPTPEWLVSSRTEIERDYDRILYASPTRRMGDKTQVFPLERNESVRTRLTHSHEVSNLARSIGTHLMNSPLGASIMDDVRRTTGEAAALRARRDVPAMLAAAGLAHDLGNPPFGHQGESAIRSWIADHASELFQLSPGREAAMPHLQAHLVQEDLNKLTSTHREDFLQFEGNAQTLRTLTRLQVVKDARGLNLSFGTLCALMKYTSGSADTDPDGPAFARKVGFFQSESGLVRIVRTSAGLQNSGARHPLTHIMEACDDIAYLVVDAEDAVKKQIVSFADLMAWLKNVDELKDDPLTKWIVEAAEEGAAEARRAKVPPSETNDVSMQIFRAHAITAMISAVVRAFEASYEDVMTGQLGKSLLDVSIARPFAKAMKSFDKQHAYQHRRVLELELDGFNKIQGLMDMLWRGIGEREKFENPASPRTTPFARYAYGRISVNYRRVFEEPSVEAGENALPIRYRELQLLTDMVAGMTDQFAIDLHQELEGFHVGPSARP